MSEKVAGVRQVETATKSNIGTNRDERRQHLIKDIKAHEVAIAELNSLSASRAVYQRHGNIFFRTNVHKATLAEQRQLELAKAKMK